MATGVSADGTFVVGSSYSDDGEGTQLQAFRWSASEGMVMLGVPTDALEGSAAARVSNDGSVVTGTNGFTIDGFYEPRNGMIWTGLGTPESDATVFAEMYFANDVSADGSLVVGATRPPAPWPLYDEAFRWSEATGFAMLGKLAGASYSAAAATSADGSVIVGFGDPDIVTALRWTEQTGMQSLTGIPPDAPSEALGITPDGQTIVGRVDNDAFWWTESDGMNPIGQLPGASWSYGLDISADAGVIVGYSDFQTHSSAFVWTARDGMREFAELLETDHGLDLSGWSLWHATGISDDGRTIVGWGINPDGETEAFVVSLACAGDFDGDDQVGISDLLVMLGTWGPCVGCPADMDGDGIVSIGDLLAMLVVWGQCGS